MRVRTDPLTLAVALGLLAPAVLRDDSLLEVHPDDADQLVRVATDSVEEPGPDSSDTVSYRVSLGAPTPGSAEE